MTSPTTPDKEKIFPVTPRQPRTSHHQIIRSPLLSPSLSEVRPFDWEAAKSNRPPPYASPLKAKSRRQSAVPNGALGSPTKGPGKRVVRKKSLYEKMTSLPSRVLFELSLLPQSIPWPNAKNSARMIGGSLHFLHFIIRVSQIRNVPDSDIGWEDMYHEDTGSSWFDWTVPMTLLLLVITILNALSLFYHTKLYHLHSQSAPVNSPNARFVSTPAPNSTSFPMRLRTHLISAFFAFWRFLLGIDGKRMLEDGAGGGKGRVQELEVWTPEEGEMTFFCVYSPLHAMLWMVWNSGNWILVFLLMGALTTTMRSLTQAYEGLLKDKAIIAAEVMHEYDSKFVNPRVNPIRSDACVQTHQSEMVNPFEDD